MSNPSTPFGFEPIGLIDGVSPNFGIRTVQLATTNAHKIYQYDVAAAIAAGYYDVATEVGGGAPIGGIFLEFKWQSVSQAMTVRSRAWLGNTADIVAGGTLEAKIMTARDATFRVRSLGSTGAAIAQASVGSNANFSVGAGPGNNLVSTFSLDDGTIGAGPSLPFTIIGIEQAPTSDPTANYNVVQVRFNNLTLI